MEPERVITHVSRDGPLGPVPVEETADVMPPALHEEKVGWGLRRCFRGQLQLSGLLHGFGDPLESREHISVHEGEIRCEAPIASERNT